MNLIIVMRDPYPHGKALTNRIHLYAKGMTELGCAVKIIVTIPTEKSKNTLNKTHSSEFDGISYEYSCGTTIRSESFICRRIVKLNGIINLMWMILTSNADAILVVSNSLHLILVCKVLARIKRILLLQEKSELPFYSSISPTILEKAYQYVYINSVYRLFDGIIAISNPLVEYFKNKVSKKTRLLFVPVIVNVDEFAAVRANNHPASEIVYCGNLSQSQDGILTLLQAFKIVLKNNSRMILKIIGDTSISEDKEKLLDAIDELSLKQNVQLTGYIARDEMVKIMGKASMLVLAKPTSLQADFCFPSKIAEYLSTGNPIIVTNLGPITDYLKHGISAYISEPNDTVSLADCMEQIINNYEFAKGVGQKGKEIALENFDYRKQCGAIKRFLEKIKNNNGH